MKISRNILVLLLAVSALVNATGMPVLVHYCGGIATEAACAPDECCGDQEEVNEEDACCTDEVTVVENHIDAETPRKDVRQTAGAGLAVIEQYPIVEIASTVVPRRILTSAYQSGACDCNSPAKLGVFRL